MEEELSVGDWVRVGKSCSGKRKISTRRGELKWVERWVGGDEVEDEEEEEEREEGRGVWDGHAHC